MPSIEDLLLGDMGDPYAALQQPQSQYDPLEQLRQIQAQNAQLQAAIGQPQTTLPVEIPQLAPAEQDSLLRRIGGSLLGSAAYLGSSVGKLGRAVRGGLGGNLRETLNFIPFSDFLGITRPEQEISGRDLLQKWGVLNENTPGFDMGDVAGFGLDIATDPLTYLGGFFGKALTAAGKEAQLAGKLTPGVAARIRAGEAGLMEAGIPFGKKLFGIEPKVIGAGSERAAKIAETVGKGWDYLSKSPLGVGTSALFEKAAQGAATLADRTISRDVFKTTKTAIEDIMTRFNSDARMLANEGLATPAGERIMNDMAEGIAQADQINPTAAKAFDDMAARHADQLADIQDMGFKVGTRTPANTQRYWPKRATGPVTLDTSKGVKGYEQALGTRAGFMKHPEEIFDVPGGKNAVNDLSVDKNLLPANPADAAADLPQRQQYVLRKTFGWDDARNAQYDDLVKSKKLNELGPLTVQSEPVAQRAYELATQRRGINAVSSEDDLVDALKELTDVRDKAIGLKSNWDQAAHLADYFGGAHQAYTETGVPLFANNAFKDGVTREIAAEQIRIVGNKMHEVLAEHGVFEKIKPVVYESVRHAPKKEGYTLLKDAVEELGLNERALARQGNMLNQAGKIADVRDVADVWIPNDVVKSLKRNIDIFKSPEALKPVTRVYDWFTNLFKTGVYAPWPASTIRDYVGGLSAVAVAAEHPFQLIGNAKWAHRVLEGTLAPEEKALAEKLVEQLAARGVHPDMSGVGEIIGFEGRHPTSLADVMKGFPENRPLGAAIKEYLPKKSWKEYLRFWETKGVGDVREAIKGNTPTVDTWALARGGRATKQYSDLMNKLTLAKNLHDAGFGIDEVMRRVNSALVDYSDLTDFERTVMRRAIPFYTFTRHMLPFTISELATKPGGAWATALKAEHRVQQQQVFTPAYLTQGLAVPLGGDENNRRYLTSLGLPFESADFMRSGPGAAQQNLMNILGQANPLLKAPLEFATNKQFFSGRDMSELYSQTGVPGLDQLISNSPLSRFASTIRTILDPRKSIAAKATNLLTGARLTDVDFAKAQASAISDAINKEIKQLPGAKTRTESYVPKDLRESLNQDQLMLLGLQRARLKEARDRAKERAKQLAE